MLMSRVFLQIAAPPIAAVFEARDGGSDQGRAAPSRTSRPCFIWKDSPDGRIRIINRAAGKNFAKKRRRRLSYSSVLLGGAVLHAQGGPSLSGSGNWFLAVPEILLLGTLDYSSDHRPFTFWGAGRWPGSGLDFLDAPRSVPASAAQPLVLRQAVMPRQEAGPVLFLPRMLERRNGRGWPEFCTERALGRSGDGAAIQTLGAF